MVASFVFLNPHTVKIEFMKINSSWWGVCGKESRLQENISQHWVYPDYYFSEVPFNLSTLRLTSFLIFRPVKCCVITLRILSTEIVCFYLSSTCFRYTHLHMSGDEHVCTEYLVSGCISVQAMGNWWWQLLLGQETGLLACCWCLGGRVY